MVLGLAQGFREVVKDPGSFLPSALPPLRLQASPSWSQDGCCTASHSGSRSGKGWVWGRALLMGLSPFIKKEVFPGSTLADFRLCLIGQNHLMYQSICLPQRRFILALDRRVFRCTQFSTVESCEKGQAVEEVASQI